MGPVAPGRKGFFILLYYINIYFLVLIHIVLFLCSCFFIIMRVLQFTIMPQSLFYSCKALCQSFHWWFQLHSLVSSTPQPYEFQVIFYFIKKITFVSLYCILLKFFSLRKTMNLESLCQGGGTNFSAKNIFSLQFMSTAPWVKRQEPSLCKEKNKWTSGTACCFAFWSWQDRIDVSVHAVKVLATD